MNKLTGEQVEYFKEVGAVVFFIVFWLLMIGAHILFTWALFTKHWLQGLFGFALVTPNCVYLLSNFIKDCVIGRRNEINR